MDSFGNMVKICFRLQNNGVHTVNQIPQEQKEKYDRGVYRMYI